MATSDLGGALLGTPGVARRLTDEGHRSMSEWVDRVRDAHDWSPDRREQLVNGIFEVRRAAAEQRLNRELNRLGLVPPSDRDRLRVRISDDSSLMRQLRRDAERQADRIIATDRKWREQWAERRKAHPYPLRNRYQINAELEQSLAARAEWKVRDIIDTEAAIAANEAAMHFYAESGVADPGSDPYWYYIGPQDQRTCENCDLLIEATAEGVTSDQLDMLLAEAGAMAPPLMHVHCRHDAEFRPPAGLVRTKDKQDAARGWACLNCHLEDITTGDRSLITPPGTPPDSVRRRFPHFVNDATVKRICGIPVGKAQRHLVTACRLLKWAVGAFVEERFAMPCEAMDDQLMGDAGEDIICQLFGLTRTEKQAPLDGVSHTLGAEIKTLRSTSNNGDPRAYMKKDALERKTRYLKQQRQMRGVTIYNIVDDENNTLRVYVREGFGSFRTSTMTHVATIDRATGKVVWHTNQLPWGEQLEITIGG